MEINSEYLKNRLSYDEVSGNLTWKPNDDFSKNWNNRYAGKVINCIGTHGYFCFNITFNGKKHHILAHRAIFCIKTGNWPLVQIDHIDRCKTNNAWSNLRIATVTENHMNCGARKTNKLGVKGVSLLGYKIDGTPRFGVFYKQEYIGTYSNVEDASNAYVNRASQDHAEFVSP